MRSTRSNSTAGTFKVHVHSRMNLKSSTGPSRKAIKQAVKNIQTARSSSRHSTYHHLKTKHVVHQSPLPRPSLCCVRKRRLPWLQLCHWQPAKFGQWCQPLYVVRSTYQYALRVLLTILHLGLVYDDSCNQVDGLTTSGNPCDQGIFGCSPPPVIFNRYTNTFNHLT